MGRLFMTALVVAAAGTAHADPKQATPASPSRQTPPATTPISSPQSATQPSNDPPPLTRAPAVAPFLAFDPPRLPAKSLRLEAIRIAGERADADWRYPEPGAVLGVEHGLFYMGYFHYRPRNARSAALHGGSVATTLIGGILLESGSPVAGVGALLTGATLDAAAADVDRDEEARRPRR